MARSLKVCSTVGCPELTDSGRCGSHRRTAERDRGTAKQRGYDTKHERRFRRQVLFKNPTCVCTEPGHGHGDGQCHAPATHADHWPHSRRELVALGRDPYHPDYGRGLCAPCDSRQTAARQPGGWAASA